MPRKNQQQAAVRLVDDGPATSPSGVIRRPLIPYIERVLNTLHQTLVERGASYADFEDNSEVFQAIMEAQGVKVPEGMSAAAFHAMSNMATKQARLATGGHKHQDSILDQAGYAIIRLAVEIRQTEEEADL